ncbi:flagellar basal body rod protein FlgB [Alkaliphilus crotonatoxidans]
MFNKIDLLDKALDASWKRNEVIANNMANAQTPNFKRSEVEFETLLKDFLTKDKLPGVVTHDNHIPIGFTNIDQLNHKVVTLDKYSTRLDGNNVDVDVEMAEEAKNTITYYTLLDQMNSHFRRLRLAINEGK